MQKGKSADARFFQSFCEEGHYGGRSKPTDTRQGIYAVSASGRFLASVNTRDARQMRRMLEEALERFEALPVAAREASAEQLAELGQVRRAEDAYPEDGLVLRVVTKDLEGSVATEAWHKSARNLDWAWFRASEARAFLPPKVEGPGQVHRVPEALVQRLARFHFVDNVRGQTSPFAAPDVQRAELTAHVEASDDAGVDLRFTGETLAFAGGDAARRRDPWVRGVELTLRGHARWDHGQKRFTYFEVVATGRRWGRTQYNAREPLPTEGMLESEGIAVLLEIVPAREDPRVAPAHFWGYGW